MNIGRQQAASSDGFADWLAREMPPGTIISDPRWWAPRILRQIGYIASSTTPASGDCSCPSGDGSLRWPCAVHPPATRAPDASRAVDDAAVPRYLIDFLLGQGPLEGFWFGDKPATERGQFWWRSRLRAALTAAQEGGPRAQPKECAHRGRIINGRGRSAQEIAWCGQCGQITWGSDADARPGAPRFEDWVTENVEAFGCAAETKGKPRCALWCGHNACGRVVTTRSTRTCGPTTKCPATNSTPQSTPQ